VVGESFRVTLTRSTIFAAAVGAVLFLTLPRHAGLVSDFVDAFTLAFCFAFLGHYVEVAAVALPDIETGVGRLVRVAVWFAGGLWCYVVARFLWVKYGRDLNELPSLIWGGVLFVAIELVVHAVLRARGRHNFYSGDSS
jgi:hypothetical protein